jgi:tRNA (guanine-N7-)-methyltransferase
MSAAPIVLDYNYIIREDQLTEPVDLRTFFERTCPLEVEIGCGKGTFMLHYSRENPDKNFIAIDWAKEYFEFTADRMRRWNISNVKVMRTDARDIVTRKMENSSIHAVHVYFPDPWPKKRHHKRRFFTSQCCKALVRVLHPEGKVFAATDHAEYFSQMERNLLSQPEFEQCEFDSPAGSDVLTNYETKFNRQGLPIYRIAVKKKLT